ncbi:unnamed protein product [Timema podura]|uniref:Homeobox domain-containing protein n=1 Tax=Timema podura TaxID=61482 RepID=A0ABN7NG21_TIMPD|nr:unnamed protein product [Timema podura]
MCGKNTLWGPQDVLARENVPLLFVRGKFLSFKDRVKIWFQNHRYKCKRQAKEKAMAEQNAQNQCNKELSTSYSGIICEHLSTYNEYVYQLVYVAQRREDFSVIDSGLFPGGV